MNLRKTDEAERMARAWPAIAADIERIRGRPALAPLTPKPYPKYRRPDSPASAPRDPVKPKPSPAYEPVPALLWASVRAEPL